MKFLTINIVTVFVAIGCLELVNSARWPFKKSGDTVDDGKFKIHRNSKKNFDQPGEEKVLFH